ncbi:MAG: AraC family transcriptional regulator [Phycisphaeraceae bacterium]|nr:AraC family transcriptional regulator [Phycisphaeraceae bacterium]
MDTLGEVLNHFHLRSLVAPPWKLNAPWGLDVPSGPPTFYAVLAGRGVLETHGTDGLELDAGDLVVLTRGSAHRLRDAAGSGLTPLHDLMVPKRAHPMPRVRLGPADGPLTRLLSGVLLFEDIGHAPWLGALPAVIYLPGKDGRPTPWLRRTLKLILEEGRASRPGSLNIISHLVQIIFTQAVRHHLATMPQPCGGWFNAAHDRDISQVLGLIHGRPDAPWTVSWLAKEAGMSRSAFAARFNSLIGQTPMAYLLACRMHRAQTLLCQTDRGLKDVALCVGYRSEAAFSAAFKRWSGCAPGEFRAKHVKP